MVVEFSNCVENLRNSIEGDIDNSFLLSSKSQEDIIKNYFEKLKFKNYELYGQVLGLLVSDHIKILNDRKKLNNIVDYELGMLGLYKKLNSTSDVIDFVSDRCQILNMLFYAMTDFNYNDYFCKREIWLNSKEELSRLSKLSSLNTIDYLYYCKRFNLDLLIKQYNELRTYYSIDYSMNEIIKVINCLCISDVENYYDLVSELLMSYYTTQKGSKILKGCQNRFNQVNPSSIIKIIETEDNKSLLETIKNDEFLIKILSQVMSDENNCNKGCQSDKTYVKTLNKLKHIRDYLK